MGKFKIPFTDVEGYINYDWDSDIFDFKLSTKVMDQNFDIVNSQVKDVSQKLIGQHLDNMVNTAEDFMKHVSPQYREDKKIVNELSGRAQNVKNIGDLNDIIKFAGENQAKYLTGEVSYQLHVATGNFVNELDQQNQKNTEDIKSNRERIDRHEDILKNHDFQLKQHSIQIANHEHRLNQHDKIIACHSKLLASHENRLNRHEQMLKVHSRLLSVHEQRLNRHEAILNNHEKRLNQHESILNMHSSMLNNHEERLNQHARAINDLYSIANEHNKILKFHGEKINELDERMFYAEKNIVQLHKQVNIHSNILSQHGEIIDAHGKCIQELYDVSNQQQIQLNKHEQLINEHQRAIIDLTYGFHDLKERVDHDEKVINNMGKELSKVIQHSIETRDIVEGLSQRTQIHQDLIIQNFESIKEAKDEIRNQTKMILYQQEIMNEMSKQIDEQWEVIQQHDKDIKELREFVNDLSKQIGNIYNEINELKNRINNLENKFNEEIIKNVDIVVEKEKIDRRVEKLIDKVGKFDEEKKSDFIKCMYMAINMEKYNLEQMEIVAKNIAKNKNNNNNN